MQELLGAVVYLANRGEGARLIPGRVGHMAADMPGHDEDACGVVHWTALGNTFELAVPLGSRMMLDQSTAVVLCRACCNLRRVVAACHARWHTHVFVQQVSLLDSDV